MSPRYLKDLAERAVKTFCQALVAVLTAGATDLLSVPWQGAMSAAGFAALLSVLTSVASAGFGSPATPSLVSPVPDSEDDVDEER